MLNCQNILKKINGKLFVKNQMYFTIKVISTFKRYGISKLPESLKHILSKAWYFRLDLKIPNLPGNAIS